MPTREEEPQPVVTAQRDGSAHFCFRESLIAWLTCNVGQRKMKRFAAILLCLIVTACSEWSLDTEWKSGAFRLIAIDAKSQMSLIHEGSPVSLVGPTIFAVGADEKHIVLKQHPADDAGLKFDRAVTRYFIVGRDRSVRAPSKKKSLISSPSL